MSPPMWDVPDHMLIPVNKYGQGPADADEAVGEACWCGGKEDCPYDKVTGVMYEDLQE